MADDFTDIANNTFRWEGGLNENEIGQGGKSNYGVSQNLYDAYNKEGSKDVSDITYGEAKKIMRSEFYDKPKLNLISNKGVRGVVYDFSVNSGNDKSIRALQEIVGTKVDGKMGKNTKRQIEKYIEKNGETALISNLIDKREQFLTNLATQNPEKYGRVIQGWMNRMQGLRDTYLQGEEDGE